MHGVYGGLASVHRQQHRQQHWDVLATDDRSTGGGTGRKRSIMGSKPRI